MLEIWFTSLYIKRLFESVKKAEAIVVQASKDQLVFYMEMGKGCLTAIENYIDLWPNYNCDQDTVFCLSVDKIQSFLHKHKQLLIDDTNVSWTLRCAAGNYPEGKLLMEIKNKNVSTVLDLLPKPVFETIPSDISADNSHSFSMPFVEFQRICRELTTISPIIYIGIDHKEVKMCGQSSVGLNVMSIRADRPGSPDGVEIKFHPDYKSTVQMFNSNMLTMWTKFISNQITHKPIQICMRPGETALTIITMEKSAKIHSYIPPVPKSKA